MVSVVPQVVAASEVDGSVFDCMVAEFELADAWAAFQSGAFHYLNTVRQLVNYR